MMKLKQCKTVQRFMKIVYCIQKVIIVVSRIYITVYFFRNSASN